MPTTVIQPQYGAVATTDKAAEYRIYLSKVLLDHAINKLQLYDLAYQVEIPKGQGSKTIRMFRPPIADIVNETEFLNTGETLTKKFGEEAALWADAIIRDACINGSTEEPTKFQKIY